MSHAARNRIAKMLVAVGMVSLLFAIVAMTGEQSCKVIANGPCGGVALTRNEIVFAAVCFAVGIVALASALGIRRRMGGPIVGPWRHW